MATNFRTFLFPNGDPQNMVAHSDYSWLSDCSIQYNPECEDCSLWQTHKVPFRSNLTTPVPDALRIPGSDFWQRLHSVLETLYWIGNGFGEVGFNQTQSGRPFVSSIPYPAEEYCLVVDSSSNVLTLESNFHPLNVIVSDPQVNPFWFPGSPLNRILFVENPTRIQEGDVLTLLGSAISGRVSPRVAQPPTGAVAGTERAWRWSVACDQPVSAAEKPGEDEDGNELMPTCLVTRPFFFLTQWAHPARTGPAYPSVRQFRRLTHDEIQALPDGELLLTRSDGQPGTIPWPLAPGSDAFLGPVRVIRSFNLPNAVREDLTAQTIAQGRWRNEHNGTLDRAYFSAGDTINGSPALSALTVAGQVLEIEYEAKALPGDDNEHKHGAWAGACRHSQLSPNARNFCGLAARRDVDFAAETVTPRPPSGLADFRADLAGGCRQWASGPAGLNDGPNVCGDYADRRAFSGHNHALALIQQAWHAAPQYVQQAISTAFADTTFRPPFPSGAPGLLSMLGLKLGTLPVPDFPPNQFTDPGWVKVDTDGDGNFRFWSGAHFRDDTPPEDDPVADYTDPATWQREGVLQFKTRGGHKDGLGRPWTDSTDWGDGMRLCRPSFVPSTTRTKDGAIQGQSEFHPQAVESNREFITNKVSLDLLIDPETSEPLEQNPTLALTATVLEDPDTPGAAGDLLLKLQTFGGWEGVAKVGAQVVDAVAVGGGLVALELSRETRAITFPLPAEPSVGVVGFSVQGGNFVKRSSRFMPRDQADEEFQQRGGNPLRGAVPGDVIRFSGVSTGDPVQDALLASVGFYVDRGLAHGGAAQPSDLPPTWQTDGLAVPWNNGDSVHVIDDGGGLLASNAAALVGSFVSVATNGKISPLRTPRATVEYATFAPASGLGVDWAPVPDSKVYVLSAEGFVGIERDWLNSNLRALPGREFCFRVTVDWLSRERKSDARHYIEIVDALERGFTHLRVNTASGVPAGRLEVQQFLNGRTGEYGVTHDLLRAYAVPNPLPGFEQSWTAGAPNLEYDPALAPPGVDPFFNQCVAGNFVPGVGFATFRVPPPDEANAGAYALFTSMARPGSTGVEPAFASPRAVLQWGAGIPLALGQLARLPAGTVVTNAQIRARWQGIRVAETRVRVFGDETQATGFASEILSDTLTEGTGALRLALASLVKDEIHGVRFPQILAASEAAVSSNGVWTTFSVTNLFQDFLDYYRAADLSGLFLIGLGPGPDPDPAADTALLGILANQAPNFHVLPYLPACVGVPPFAQPANNPDAGDLDVTFTNYAATWDGLEVWPNANVEIALPATDPTGGVHRLYNTDYNQNAPGDETFAP